MVVLGTRRLCQPPRLLENYKIFSRRRNSAWCNRSLVSSAAGILDGRGTRRNRIAASGLLTVRFVSHVRSSGSALRAPLGGIGRCRGPSDRRGPAHRNLSPRFPALRRVAGSHHSNRGLLERGRRVTRRSRTGRARPGSAANKQPANCRFQNGDADVIVIGGGIAGLGAGVRLKDRGLEPLVLEAESRVGGRMTTDRINGFVVDRGVTLFGNAFGSMRALVKRLRLSPLVCKGKFSVGIQDG